VHYYLHEISRCRRRKTSHHKRKSYIFFSLNNFITVFEGKMLNYMLSRNGFFVFSQMSNADSQQRVEGVSSYEDARRERGVVPIYWIYRIMHCEWGPECNTNSIIMNNNDTDDNNRSLELELNFEHSCICINSLSHPARSARKQKNKYRILCTLE